ncbi:fumarylacetoacetate hydrolase family protein [Burkholderia pseudomultivorans]|uniref:fumarylacetoacetate hydrolase family protein n=1 Tax=Burkholderia pseudomultivorans TaxID=1207504 RepID=UPI00188FEC7B|nr:fumarylacetoacetate hydrolase family protein [Burkholderia pseudomultivorans]MBF5010889.1 fumarylacetoacetate hydrolase family protein [Burkholderia pseudomultivorans]
MKLLRFNLRDGDSLARTGVLLDDGIVEMHEVATLDDLLACDDLLTVVHRAITAAAASRIPLADVHLLPPLTAPQKIWCIGVNYKERNEEYEDNSDLPRYPSLFARNAGSFVGHDDALIRPRVSEQLDYEGELVLVIGKAGRHVPRERAFEHIAGMTLANEGSVRDWLKHGKFNVTQGKNFDASGSLGPWIVTADECDPSAEHTIQTRVNGELRQNDTTARLMFPFDALIAYLTTFATLQPGDLILTGTPTGTGWRQDPPSWLKPGDVVEIHSPGIGTLRNTVAHEA